MKKIFIIDNADSIYKNFRRGGFETVLLCDGGENISLLEYVEKIKTLSEGDDYIFIINVNLDIKESHASGQSGVEILKYLRFDREIPESVRKSHCILYSFVTIEDLLREKPENIIICSKGVSFVKMPEGIDIQDIENIITLKADLGELAVFIRGEFNINEARHKWANKWGVKKLWDVHRHIDDTFKDDYPESVQKALKDIQAIYAVNLFDNDDSISKETKKFIKQIQSERNDFIKNKKPRILYIDDMWNEGWLETLSNIFYGTAGKTVIDNINNLFFHKNNIGEEIIFGINDYKNKNDNSIIKAINKLIEDNKPEIILLDLRLKDEEENIRFESLSGQKILEEIRNTDIAIPVIIITASNKEWILQKMLENGANYFWIKEGFDDRRSFFDSIQNYKKLLDFIKISVESDYKFLRKISDKLSEMRDNNSSYWWENPPWDGKRFSVNKKDILEIIENGILLYREYLQNTYGNYNFFRHADMYFWLSSIINKTGAIIEKIHNLHPSDSSDKIGANYKSNSKTKKTDITDNNGDYIGQILYLFRNSSSHLKESMMDNFEIDHFKVFFAGLLTWLNPNKFHKVVPLDKILNKKWSDLDNQLQELIYKMLL
jgi:CheY-like chemotaxis protein